MVLEMSLIQNTEIEMHDSELSAHLRTSRKTIIEPNVNHSIAGSWNRDPQLPLTAY